MPTKSILRLVLGTLNHLIVGDTIWLKRFSTHPANYSALAVIKNLPVPKSLDQTVFADIQSLSERRKLLDQTILDWARSITEHDLDFVLSLLEHEEHRRKEKLLQSCRTLF